MRNFTFFLVLFCLLCPMYAVDVSLIALRTTSDQQGLAIDSVTGKFYTHAYSSSTYVRVYNNEADFINNIYSTVNFSSGSIYNNYFAVENGKVFGRTSSSTNDIGRWSATTGALELTGTATNMVGTNGQTGGFSWGGYSSVNWFNDGGDLYVIGKTISDSTNYEWRVSEIDSNLQTTSTQTFLAGGTLGFGFVINGKFFSGSAYNSNVVNKVYDMKTGILSNVSFNLVGAGASLYWRDATYNALSDTLYLYNYNSPYYFYKIENASVVFNAPPVNIPEPSGYILLVLFSTIIVYISKKR